MTDKGLGMLDWKIIKKKKIKNIYFFKITKKGGFFRTSKAFRRFWVKKVKKNDFKS